MILLDLSIYRRSVFHKKKIFALRFLFCGWWLFLSILRKMMQSRLEFTFSRIWWYALILTPLTRCTGVHSLREKKSTGFSEIILNQSSISFNPPLTYTLTFFLLPSCYCSKYVFLLKRQHISSDNFFFLTNIFFRVLHSSGTKKSRPARGESSTNCHFFSRLHKPQQNFSIVSVHQLTVSTSQWNS